MLASIIKPGSDQGQTGTFMIKAPTRLLLGDQRKHSRAPVTIAYLETCVSFLFLLLGFGDQSPNWRSVSK